MDMEKKIETISKTVNSVERIVKERKRTHDKDIGELREAIYDITDKLGEKMMPLINLKNGNNNLMPMSEGIEQTWNEVKEVQKQLKILDKRTIILGDIQIVIANWKEIRNKIHKYSNPILKGLVGIIATFLFFWGVHSLITGKINLWDFISKIWKLIF